MLERYFFIILILFISIVSPGQKEKTIDSLKRVIKSNVHDTVKINAIQQLDDIIYISDPLLDAQLNQQILDISKANIEIKGISEKEFIFYKKALIHALNILGITNDNNGAYTVALDYYYQSLKHAEDINDLAMIGGVYNNIGLIHNVQLDYDKALSFYVRSLDIKLKLEDKRGTATTLNNIGNIYLEKKEVDSALAYYANSLEIAIELEDNEKIGSTLDNIGVAYQRMELLDSARVYFQKSVDYLEKLADWEALSNSLFNLGMIYFETGEPLIAINLCKRGYDLAAKFEGIYRQSFNCECLYKSYKKIGKIDSALYYFEILDTIADILTNDENTRIIAQKEMSYEHQKEVLADSVKHQNELQLSKSRLDKVEVEKKNANLRLTMVLAGAFVLLIIGFLIYNRLKLEQKQKLLIEEEKEKVEEKNKEILDSINYAKRIQNAILPPAKLVKEYLEDSFVLYKPKDVVAGDFYWLETAALQAKVLETNETQGGISGTSGASVPSSHSAVLFAAADCTGHGVPGAMVSVICNNGLNRSVREHRLTDPGQILDKTREIVIQEFEKSEEDVKDGMDIALCRLEFNSSSFGVSSSETVETRNKEQGIAALLQYAGANNPLWIIRNGEIIETKANKQPIGKFENPKPYTTHTFELQKGDSFYIFSDGYADQFGGERGKKFKSKAFKELLISIQHKSMEEQKECIDVVFEEWRGDLEQIDDVCVIGVRV